MIGVSASVALQLTTAVFAAEPRARRDQLRGGVLVVDDHRGGRRIVLEVLAEARARRRRPATGTRRTDRPAACIRRDGRTGGQRRVRRQRRRDHRHAVGELEPRLHAVQRESADKVAAARLVDDVGRQGDRVAGVDQRLRDRRRGDRESGVESGVSGCDRGKRERLARRSVDAARRVDLDDRRTGLRRAHLLDVVARVGGHGLRAGVLVVLLAVDAAVGDRRGRAAAGLGHHAGAVLVVVDAVLRVAGRTEEVEVEIGRRVGREAGDRGPRRSVDPAVPGQGEAVARRQSVHAVEARRVRARALRSRPPPRSRCRSPRCRAWREPARAPARPSRRRESSSARRRPACRMPTAA